MHPAGSVIIFTTLTGFGYGLLCWLALAFFATDAVPSSVIYMVLSVAGVLNIIGLSASTWHLGHPERAWRAMSQFRSSWLSREGVAAILSFLPLLGLAVATYWQVVWAQQLTAVLLLLLSLLTVFTTAMIYASLKPIAAWHNGYTIIGYWLHALITGGALWWFLLTLPPAANLQSFMVNVSLFYPYLLLLFAMGLVNKLLWLRRLHSSATGDTSVNSAIGMSGEIRQLDPPHSAANYLMQEMGYRIARNHSFWYRLVAIVGTYVLPFLLLLYTTNVVSMSVLLLSCMLGIVAERYLFFAEAKHTVSLYYQR